MILREVIREGDVVIDATAGNGHDTAFLAECVGRDGRVIAFDIQREALDSARIRLEELGMAACVEFHHRSHAEMGQLAEPGTVSAVMFNLGYLPGGDHELATMAGETLRAIEAATILIKPGGALSVICYPGHEAGEHEAEAVERHITDLTRAGWRLASYKIPGTLKPAPFLLIGRKP
jgi:tRNA A58 N-methylase Trm61